MRQYHTELRETKELEKIICNKCGKEIVVTRGIPQEDVLDIEKRWGYFSEKTDRRIVLISVKTVMRSGLKVF